MTETRALTATDSTPALDFVAKRVRVGVLSNLEPREIDGQEIMLGTLTRTVKGVSVDETISVTGDALVAVRDLLVNGANVRLYGEIHADYVKVIGPDLTKRTLAREAARAEKRAQPAPVSKNRLAARRGVFIARARAAKAANPA